MIFRMAGVGESASVGSLIVELWLKLALDFSMRKREEIGSD